MLPPANPIFAEQFTSTDMPIARDTDTFNRKLESTVKGETFTNEVNDDMMMSAGEKLLQLMQF